MITRGCDSKGIGNKRGGPENGGVITSLLRYYHAKLVVVRPTPKPGVDSKDPRFAAIPENVTGKALICCCAGATFGSGLLAMRRNKRPRRER